MTNLLGSDHLKYKLCPNFGEAYDLLDDLDEKITTSFGDKSIEGPW